ncbi:PaaI family thioesterase [Marinobacter salarius]|uniref:PaaI family thioesterase n=1 Tax=Marinobacter salarius TaxID=1420917 RepID=UPI0032ECB669
MKDESRTVQTLQASIDECPFNAFSGFQIESWNDEEQVLTLTMPLRAEFERLPGSGQIHGGPIASLIDTAGCYALMAVTGSIVATITFRTDYLRPAKNTALRAVATVRKAGRSVGVVDVDVVNECEKLVAIGRGTYSSTSSLSVRQGSVEQKEKVMR